MVTTPILVFPYCKKEFHVHVETSNIMLGTMLTEPGESNIDHRRAFVSRKLLKEENNYSITEHEGLEMVSTLPKFWHFC